MHSHGTLSQHTINHTLYQYHIHIRQDTHAVYAASAGSKSENVGILFQELPTKIDDN